MIPIQFPAGVTTLASKNAQITNWRECHLVRWDNGTTLRPVGGWEKTTLGPFASRIRKMHRWITNSNILMNAYLCEAHCYVESVGTLTDITPVGGMVPAPPNIAGYGDDKYNMSNYNTPRPGPSHRVMGTNIYSLDNWGEELRVMTSQDGRYLAWRPSTPATPLVAVAGAPTGNRSFVITPERHAMIFGMNDFGKFGWSDEQDDTDWVFTDITSRAGFYDVSPRSPIITQQLFDSGILMFTSVMSYVIEWVGLPYVYSYHPIGQIAIPYSPASICTTPKGVVWPSTDGWWIYDGTSPRIIPCAIWDRIQDTIDVVTTRSTGACVHVANKGEVWWFYTDKNSPNLENNRYAIYDYRSEVWSMGTLNRTCGYVYANDPHPLMSDGVSVFKHESGFQYPGSQLPWIESQNLSPNGGENWITINKILPDVQGDSDALRWSVVKTNFRDGYVPEVYSPQRKKNGSGYVDIRETARDMRLRMDMVKNSDWGTVGPILFDIKARGKK